MPAIDYKSYLASPAWRARRLDVIRRCRGVCERCNRWPVVNVHHLTYERVGSELPGDLLGVCIKCHQDFHEATSR